MADTDSSPHKKTSIFNNKVMQAIVGYGIAIAALIWVFHDIKVTALQNDIAHINWWLVALGMFVDIGRYISQSYRWSLLIRAIKPIKSTKTFQALYAGIFLNLILPLRIGEIARAYLASRYSGARFSSIVSTLFTEYFIDGIWLAMFVAGIAFFVPLPKEVLMTSRILGVATILVTVLFIFLVFYKRDAHLPNEQKANSPLWKPLKILFSFLNTTRHGLQIIGISPKFWGSLAVSALHLVFHVLAFWIVMIAYGIHLPLITATAILIFIFIGLIIPNTPSNVGPFQFLCVVGLMAFGIDKTEASGFSVLVFFVVNIPQIVIGWVAFSRSGEKLYEIKHHINDLRLSLKDN